MSDEKQEMVETNEGPLPSSNANSNPIEVSNINPDGIDVGTNAIELSENPYPSQEQTDVPASAIVRNVLPQAPSVDTNVNFDGSIRSIQGDYIVDYYPQNDVNADATETDTPASAVVQNVIPVPEETQLPQEPAPQAEPAGEEYTQTVETPTNDFQAVMTETVPEGEEELKKPRRYSRT
jgi:hypothetical protein